AVCARGSDNEQRFAAELAERDLFILQVRELVIKDRCARRLRRAAWCCRGQCCQRSDNQCVDRSGEHTFLHRQNKNSRASSDNRLSRLGGSRKQVVLGKKFDHKPIKKPGLFYLAGVPRSRQCFQLAIWYEFLE